MSTALLPIESQASVRRLPAPPRWLVIAFCAFALLGFAFGYLGSWPPAATVMSGSMSPTIDTGDVVILKRLRGAPHVGDIVAVPVPEHAREHFGYPPEVIHRVVRIAPDGAITTKGDAKPQPDPFTVPASAVRAKVLTHIPAAGRVIAFLTSSMGLVWIAAGIALFVVLPFLERRQDAREAEHDALEAMRGELHAMSAELARLQKRPPPPPPPEPASHVVTRRSGGLLGRLRKR